jgi:hypothetical protein
MLEDNIEYFQTAILYLKSYEESPWSSMRL